MVLPCRLKLVKKAKIPFSFFDTITDPINLIDIALIKQFQCLSLYKAQATSH